jgi:hypothetical protein
MNLGSHLSLPLLLVSSLVGLEGLTSGCEGRVDLGTPELEAGPNDAEPATAGPYTLDSGTEGGHDGSAKPDSGIGSGGGGQCAAIGAQCPTIAELQADGGYIFEQTACCGSAVCAPISCCYSACQSYCTAPADLCCSSGNPCHNDDQCCSGTCLHADAAIVPPNLPGGSCM